VKSLLTAFLFGKQDEPEAPQLKPKGKGTSKVNPKETS
jgi:hypothetical protein